MVEQKIKQDICIGANIRRMREQQGIGQTALVRLLQLEGVDMTGLHVPKKGTAL